PRGAPPGSRRTRISRPRARAAHHRRDTRAERPIAGGLAMTKPVGLPAATLFIDRDGTVIEEPPDEQVDSLEKVRFMPGVFAALAELTRHGYRLVMVTNQDGLGTDTFPTAAFERPQQFILETLRSQEIEFHAVFVCPHVKSDGRGCRKPKTGLVEEYIRTS